MAATPVVCFRLGTWNLKQFSTKQPEGKTHSIVGSIKESGADIVAVQEVQDPAALALIVEGLGDGWGFLTHEKPAWQGKNFKEFHGFIYKNTCEPLSCYSIDSDRDSYYVGNSGLFHKSPVFAGFVIKGQCNVAICSVHTKADTPLKDIQNLKYCAKAIKKSNPAWNNIVVLGDFNASVDTLGFEKLVKKGYKAVLDCSIPTNELQNKQYDNMLYSNTLSCERSLVWVTENNQSDHRMVCADMMSRCEQPEKMFYRPDIHGAYSDKKKAMQIIKKSFIKVGNFACCYTESGVHTAP